MLGEDVDCQKDLILIRRLFHRQVEELLKELFDNFTLQVRRGNMKLRWCRRSEFYQLV